jgi:hypothetical protein
MGNLHKVKSIHMTTLRRILFTKRNFSERFYRGKLFTLKHFLPENSAFYEKMWKNTLKTDRHGTYDTLWCMRFACQLDKARNTQSE